MKKGLKGDKVSIIGAGNVGAALAQRILEHDLANVVLLDIDEGISMGKACDLMDASPVMGYEKEIVGTKDYASIKDSKIVAITAGFPRKPGMTRKDLIKINGAVVKELSLKIKEYAPDAIVIVVTNPLDVMCYLTYKTTAFDRKKVLGMAGVLDSARCSNLIAEELGIMRTEVDSIVIGSHDTNMVPLLAHSNAQGKPLKDVLDEKRQNDIIEKTKKRGATIVQYLKKGSAFFAPSAAGLTMIKSILNNELLTLCASVYLNGEYGFKDIFLGVPVVLGKEGIKRVVQLELSEEERSKLKTAADAVREYIEALEI